MQLNVPDRFADHVRAYIVELEEQEAREELCQINLQKAADYWNQNIPNIEYHITAGDDPFKWNQLVWQELNMWACLSRPVNESEFDDICLRRGFTQTQRQFLLDGLVLMNLKLRW